MRLVRHRTLANTAWESVEVASDQNLPQRQGEMGRSNQPKPHPASEERHHEVWEAREPVDVPLWDVSCSFFAMRFVHICSTSFPKSVPTDIRCFSFVIIWFTVN